MQGVCGSFYTLFQVMIIGALSFALGIVSMMIYNYLHRKDTEEASSQNVYKEFNNIVLSSNYFVVRIDSEYRNETVCTLTARIYELLYAGNISARELYDWAKKSHREHQFTAGYNFSNLKDDGYSYIFEAIKESVHENRQRYLDTWMTFKPGHDVKDFQYMLRKTSLVQDWVKEPFGQRLRANGIELSVETIPDLYVAIRQQIIRKIVGKALGDTSVKPLEEHWITVNEAIVAVGGIDNSGIAQEQYDQFSRLFIAPQEAALAA